MKAELVAKGMAEKLITYTPRYNAFIEGGAYNTNEFRTDGEGIDVVEYSASNGRGASAEAPNSPVDLRTGRVRRRELSVWRRRDRLRALYDVSAIGVLATRGDGVRSYAIDATRLIAQFPRR